AHVGLGFGLLDPGPLLHQLHQVPAVHLDHVPYVCPRHPQRHQDLHHQLVPRRRTHVGRRAQPPGQLGRAGRGNPETLLRAVLAVVIRLDQSVALPPLQGRVDLAHVQRPDLPGPRLELLTQLKPLLRTVAEQREQRVPDAHAFTITSSILGIVLDMPRFATGFCGGAARAAEVPGAGGRGPRGGCPGCAGRMRGGCDGMSAGAWRDAPLCAPSGFISPEGAVGTTAMPHRRGQNHYGVTLPWLGLDTRGWRENAGARHEPEPRPVVVIWGRWGKWGSG